MKQDPAFWHIAFPVTLLLAAGSIWLYRNIDIRNADKKWFRLLFSGKEWTSVIRAMKYLGEIEEHKKKRRSNSFYLDLPTLNISP
jgi:hypothetical protein